MTSETQKSSKKTSSEAAFFKEKQQTIDIIGEVVSAKEGNIRKSFYDEHVSKLLIIFDKYQEQSQLLGPHIVDLINPINEGVLRYLELSDQSVKKFNTLCTIIQIICKVRGQKNVAKHLPHEVHHFESCLRLLHRQDKNNHDTWQTRYVLLLWMSTLCLTPFDIYSIDSSSIVLPSYIQSTPSGSAPLQSLITIVIETAKVYLSDFGPTREAAAVCLSSMLTRPDADMNYLNEFLLYSIRQFQYYFTDTSTNASNTKEEGSENTDATFSYTQEISQLTTQQQRNCLYLGILFSLNQIFKRGHREKLLLLLSSIQNLLHIALQLIEVSKQTLERKFLCKLLQRIGMTLLIPIEATWRYQKGYRSMNLSSLRKHDRSSSVIAEVTEISKTSSLNSDEIEIPEEIEEIMDKMLTFLSDKDTVVRWSAAKGVGRLTLRLNKSFGLDILQAIVQQFDDKLSEHIWHGGCLALAELSRRGLLLPDNLCSVVPLIVEALTFDLQKGQHFVGANIRDAACYVCWAFARAYSPLIMKPYMKDLSLGLLSVALFDREINCRRAASAAFQENVGRQGNENFLFGIEIITIADFFAVSNRVRSFLDLSVEIVRLDVHYYFTPFIVHLKDYKINHWDREIRELSSKAIAKLFVLVMSVATTSDTGSYANELISALLDDCLSEHLYTRHGSLLTVARLLTVLILRTSHGFVLSDTNNEKLEQLIPVIEKKRLYRGRGGELIREAVCQLVESLSRLRFQFKQKILLQILDSLNDQLKQPQINIQRKAKNALRQFLFYYFAERRDIPPKIVSLTVQKYIDVLKPGNEGNVAIVRGFVMALGTLPDRFLSLPYSSPTALEAKASTLPSPKAASLNINNNLDKKVSDVFEDSELPVVTTRSLAVMSPPTSLSVPATKSDTSDIVATLNTHKVNLEVIFDILDDYSNNTKLINGEYDAETCQYAIESAVELAERLSTSFLFEDSFLARVFRLLLKGCNDYSIDKRGDTGSWVRLSALKGMERLLAMIYGNISLSMKLQTLSPSSQDVRGSLIQTSFGIGAISSHSFPASSSSSSFRSSNIVEVSYCNPSLGFEQSLEEEWMMVATATDARQYPGSASLTVACEPQVEENLRQNKVLEKIQKYAVFFVSSVSLEESREPAILIIMRQLLKQLSEKLDSVRNVAGNILERILFQRFLLFDRKQESGTIGLDIPDEQLLVNSIKRMLHIIQSGDATTTQAIENSPSSEEAEMAVEEGNEKTENEESPMEADREDDGPIQAISSKALSSSVNWHRPDHVYPIIVNCLASSLYFHDVFTGLVVSMGGLTEAIVKSSTQAFLQYSKTLLTEEEEEEEEGKEALPNNSKGNIGRSTFLIFLVSSIERLFQNYHRNDRIILPLLKTLHILMKQNLFHTFARYVPENEGYTRLDQFYSSLVLRYLFEELKATSQVSKFFLLIDVYLLLLGIKSTAVHSYQIPRRKILFYLLQLLSHRFPRVRKYTAEALYVYLISDHSLITTETKAKEKEEDDSLSQHEAVDFTMYSQAYDEIVEILTITAWDCDTLNNLDLKEMIQERRNRILVLLHYDLSSSSSTEASGKGKTKNSSKSQKSKERKDELDSYDALVREAGY